MVALYCTVIWFDNFRTGLAEFHAPEEAFEAMSKTTVICGREVQARYGYERWVWGIGKRYGYERWAWGLVRDTGMRDGYGDW